LVKADTLEDKPKQRFPYIRHDIHHVDYHHIDNSRQPNELNRPARRNKSRN
jgi:hypothetical protein